MVGKHLTIELLEDLYWGTAPPHELVEGLVEHVVQDCGQCRKVHDDFVGIPQDGEPPAYEATFVRALEQTEHRNRTLSDRRRQAKQDFDLLAELEPAEARARVFRASDRFRSPFLVNLLIAESRRRVTADPFEAYELAELAHEVALRVPHELYSGSWAATSIALANAYRANALRAVGDGRTADPILEGAIDLFTEEGSGDPLIEAELMGLQASLRKDQRRFDEAEYLLGEVLTRYRESGEDQLAGRTLILRGELYHTMGEPERAIEEVHSAIELIDRESEPRLYLYAQHNLTVYLQDSERYDEAHDQLLANRPLYEAFPEPWTQLRYRWLAGKIARGQGNLEDAERELTAALNGFIEQGLAYDAALAGLDVALVYLQQGRTAEVRKLAEQMVPIFQARDIHREALAAFLLFQQAAQREAATIAMVEELAASMEKARRSSPRPC